MIWFLHSVFNKYNNKFIYIYKYNNIYNIYKYNNKFNKFINEYKDARFIEDWNFLCVWLFSLAPPLAWSNYTKWSGAHFAN